MIKSFKSSCLIIYDRISIIFHTTKTIYISYLCRIFVEDLHVTSRFTRKSLIKTKKYLKSLILLLICKTNTTCLIIWLNDCKTKYKIVYFIHIFSQPSLKTFWNIFNALLGYNKITLFNLWIYRRLLNNINSYNSDMTWLLFTNNGLYNIK